MAMKPGDYITAKCSRCNDITGHVIMLILDGEISKVECKACGSVHKYREAKAAKQGRAQGPAVRKVRAGESREKAVEVRQGARSTSPDNRPSKIPTTKLSAAKAELAWEEAMRRHIMDEPVPYSMQHPFKAQDLVEHPVFGRGEVVKMMPPDKMEILFQEGVKLLRCKT